MSGERALRRELERIAAALAGSRTDVSLELKLKAAELILRLMGRKKRFGLFVILGWQRKWNAHLDISDSEQDIFADHRMDLRRVETLRRNVSTTLDFDGAILIDRKGAVVHSGVFIEGLRPRIAAQRLNPGRFDDLSEQFGFETKVHARHLSAITASYIFKGTTVFTVSEENGDFHIFEGGRITHHS